MSSRLYPAFFCKKKKHGLSLDLGLYVFHLVKSVVSGEWKVENVY